LDNLQNERNSQDKELALLRSDIDRLNSLLSEKEEYINKLRGDYDEDKKEMNQKIEEYNSKYQFNSDKYLTEKLEFTKEIAVLKQQVKN
jgi:chromosome segregation ATPase